MKALLFNALKPGTDVTDELKYTSENTLTICEYHTLIKTHLPTFKLNEVENFNHCTKFTVLFKAFIQVKSAWSRRLLIYLIKTDFGQSRYLCRSRRLKTWNQIRFNN